MLVYLAHGISQTGSFVIATFKEASHVCGTCVRHIQHKANITRPLHTWRTCSAIKTCFLQHRSEKKWPSLTTLNCHTVSQPVGSVLSSSKEKKMYTA